MNWSSLAKFVQHLKTVLKMIPSSNDFDDTYKDGVLEINVNEIPYTIDFESDIEDNYLVINFKTNMVKFTLCMLRIQGDLEILIDIKEIAESLVEAKVIYECFDRKKRTLDSPLDNLEFLRYIHQMNPSPNQNFELISKTHKQMYSIKDRPLALALGPIEGKTDNQRQLPSQNHKDMVYLSEFTIKQRNNKIKFFVERHVKNLPSLMRVIQLVDSIRLLVTIVDLL